jgi:hypothetical protein
MSLKLLWPLFPSALIFQKHLELIYTWNPTGKARGTSIDNPPTPLGPEALRCAGTKASGGLSAFSEAAEAVILDAMNQLFS